MGVVGWRRAWVCGALVLSAVGGGGCAHRAAPPDAPRSAPARAAAPVVEDVGYAADVVRAGGVWKVTIEYVDVLHGDRARKAALEDGAIKDDEPLEGDVYVRSTDDEPATFVLEPGAPILASTGPDTPPKPVTVEALAKAVRAPDDHPEELSGAVFRFSLKGDRIVRMEEVYLP